MDMEITLVKQKPELEYLKNFSWYIKTYHEAFLKKATSIYIAA